MNLIIGATGMVGNEICRLLRGDSKSVRAMVRETSDPVKVNKLKELGVEIVKGDLRDSSTFAGALQGVLAVITTVSAMPFSYVRGENDIQNVDLDGMTNLINSAKKAGVKHFIYTSFSGQIDMDFPLRNAKRAVEKHLQKSGFCSFSCSFKNAGIVRKFYISRFFPWLDWKEGRGQKGSPPYDSFLLSFLE